MSFSPEIRRYLIPAAWLGTAALTFCIGRISSYIDAPTAAPNATARVGEVTAAAPEPTLSATPISTSESGSFSNPVEQVTGGQPVRKWLERILKEEDEIVRMNGFMRLLDVLNTGEEIQEALAAVAISQNGWTRGKEFSMLLQKWAQIDPSQAMTYVESLKDQNQKFGGYRAVLSTWTRRNATEAVAWAEKNGVNEQGGEGNWAMATIVGQLSKSDPDWALRLTQGQTLSRARGRMADAVIAQYISQRGEAAAREMVKNIPEEALRNGMLGRISAQLAADDPAATSQWVSTLPAGDGRQRAMTELISQWSEKDPAAAATYLTKFPPSPETDESRDRLAQNVLRADPEGALAWAGTISDAKYRASAVANLVRNWKRRDEAAAQKWVELHLPSDQQAQPAKQPGS